MSAPRVDRARLRRFIAVALLGSAALLLGGASLVTSRRPIAPLGVRRPSVQASSADSVVVFAIQKYVHTGSSSSWTLFDDSFNADTVAGRRYVLEVVNGTTVASGARVSINSQEFLGTSEFGTGTSRVLREIDVTPGSNAISTQVKGSGSAWINVRVVRVWDPTFIVHGPTTFTYTNGTPQTDTFSIPSGAKSPYFLRAINGAPSGTNRVTNATLWLNGSSVLSSSDVGTGVATVSKTVTLTGTNDRDSLLNQSGSGTKISLRYTATDSTAPVVVLTNPTADTTLTTASSLLITGRVTDETAGTITLGTAGTVATPDTFHVTLNMPTNATYPLPITAINGAQLTTTLQRTVIRDTLSPTIVTTRPSSDASIVASADTFAILGYIADSTRTVLTVDADTALVGSGSHASFSYVYHLDPGQNGIVLRAKDALGHTTQLKRWINRSLATETLKDSIVSASSATTSGVRDFKESVQFLYTAGSPLQTSVIDDSIASTRAAVVRGWVVGRDAAALSNVTVSVLGHPEFGSTVSRADGVFDMVVNGGSRMTLKFNKAGFLESQRQVLPPVNDYAFVDSVGMVGKSANFTVVDLSGGQFSRSRLATDANGDRDVRLLFKPGTVAKVFKPNGDSVSYSTSVRTRVSEVTIGPTGQVAMPASLPPGSAYGYCTDFSLIEADSIADAVGAGSLETRFSQPVVAYVRNFLHLPVGAFMPNGTYDGTTGTWKPDTDAVVVKILGFSASGDTARIDLTGSGVAADSASLAAYHFDGYELTHLRSQFSSGDSLMRTMAAHFSERDLNPPEYPAMPPLTLGQKLLRAFLWLFGCTTDEHGSIIECESCVLGESVPVTGTPFTLNYRSYRAQGDKAIRTLRVPIFGDSVPPAVYRVIAYMDVAGKRYQTIDTTPAKYDSATFVWDGKDAYGRVVEGAVNAHVSIGYQTASLLVLGSGGRTFGNQTQAGTVMWEGLGDRSVPQTTWIRTKLAIGAPSCATDGLGGWMLSEHHFYDPHGDGALYLGSGKAVLGAELPPIVTYVEGCILGNTCDPHLTMGPSDIAVSPDGTVYMADMTSNSIYKRAPSGATTRYAGTGSIGAYVDNVAASSCPLINPKRIALGPDGSLYLVMDIDGGSSHYQDKVPRACRITPDGVIHRLTKADYAPNWISTGDGGPALNATVTDAKSIAVGPDGSVFIGDYGASSAENLIRRIGPDGIISTYAGGLGLSESDNPTRATASALTGCEGLALDANGTLFIAEYANHRVKQVSRNGIMSVLMSGSDLVPVDLDLAPDGSLYVTSAPVCGYGGCPRILKRDPDGNVTVFAGRSDGHPEVQGGYGTAVGMSADGIGIGPDGEVYIADYLTVIKIQKPYPTRLTKTFTLASPDGSEIYAFDKLGRHLWTRDALTGGVRYLFNYDGSGQLKSIYDSNGDSTRITRSGSTITITAPNGQVTTLGLDGYNYLQTITDPASQQIVLSNSSDGLLQSYTDANSQTHNLTYGSDGRLSVDADPASGSQTLTSGAGLNRRHVERTTALGRKTTYDVLVSDGAQQHYVTGPDGLTISSSTAANGTAQTTLPAGVVVTDSVRPNPNATTALTSQVLTRTKVTMPSGLARLTDIVGSSAALGVPGASGTWTQQVKINSRTPYTTTLTVSGTPSTAKLVGISAVGRRDSTVIDSVGRPSSVSIPGIAALTLGYDGRGRLASAIRGNQRMSYGYDSHGRLATIRDTLQRMVTLGYDNADRATSVTLPDGRQIQLVYDANGNVTSVTPPGGHAHAFDYSAVDQALHYTPPTVSGVSSPATAYTYNDDHQLTKVTRPDGALISLAYNSTKERLDSITVARGKSTLYYNSTTGLLDSLSSPDTISVRYTRDGDLPLSEQWAGRLPGISSLTVSRTFNAQFQESTQTVGSTSAVSFSHDLDGMLTGAGSLSIHRNTQNGLVDSTQVSNLISGQDYDALGNLANLRYRVSGGSTLFQQSLVRDGLGRITQIVENAFGTSRTYGYRYDLAGRLYGVKLNSDTIALYGYDADGNRTSFKNPLTGDTASATYDDQDRMLRYKDTRYAYTAAGDLSTATIGSSVTCYTYDALGALLKVVLPSGDSITYSVDGTGRRVGRRYNGAWQGGWVYEGPLSVVGELDSTGAVLNRYIYGADGQTPALMVRGGATYRVIVDQLGSVRGIVDASNGTVLQQTEYDAWGVPSVVSGAGIQFLGYAGGLTDTSTGLVRFGVRDYEPGKGRWTARDPLFWESSVGASYTYADDQPVNLRDVTGLSVSYIDCLAIRASEFWAEKSLDSSLPWIVRKAAWIPGLLATLWTPQCKNYTALILGAAAGADQYVNRPYYQYYPSDNPGYDSPWMTRGRGWDAPYETGEQARAALNLPDHNPATAVREVRPGAFERVAGPRPVAGGSGIEYRSGSLWFPK